MSEVTLKERRKAVGVSIIIEIQKVRWTGRWVLVGGRVSGVVRSMRGDEWILKPQETYELY